MSNLPYAERNAIAAEAMRRVNGAYEAIKLIRYVEPASEQGLNECEKIIGYLEMWAKNQPAGTADLALHMAVALRASLMSPVNAQAMYAELGANWTKKHYGC